MAVFEEQGQLIRAIMSGKASYSKVKAALDKMEEQYGEDAFTYYNLTKKAPPWSKQDLEELYDLCVAGVASRDVFLHMAEISDYLKQKKQKKLLAICAGALLLIAIAVGIIVYLHSK